MGAGLRRTALNSRRASCSWCHRSVVHPFFWRAPSRAGSLMAMWIRVGEGSKHFAHSPPQTSRPPVYVLVKRVRAVGEGQEMGVGVSGVVREAAMLRESHCNRIASCTGEQKHGKEQNLGYIRVIFARMEITCICDRDMQTRHANMRANLTIFCESKRG